MRFAAWIAGCAVALLACGGGAETLTVVSWGGAYEQASRKAVLEPFTAETGIEVAVEVYNGVSPRYAPRSRRGMSTGTSWTSSGPTRCGLATRGCSSSSASTTWRRRRTGRQ